MALTKAVIEILDDDAVDPGRGLPQRIEVQFNPAQYRLSKGAQIAEIAIPGIDSPILQFIRGQNEKLTMELFFDTSNEGMGEGATDVRERTNAVYQLVKIQPRTHAPPRIRFVWGKGLSFQAIVESVEQSFTLFNPEGVPLRATLSVAFREYKTLEEQISELNLQSSDHTKTTTVRARETLSGIAFREYDDARLWRLIAEANPSMIDNPLRLAPGTVLELPPREEFRRGRAQT